jgi:hypothetical protein
MVVPLAMLPLARPSMIAEVMVHRRQRGVLAQRFEAREDLRHVAQVGRQVLVANDPDQGHLQHLPQLAQQRRHSGGAQGAPGIRAAPADLRRSGENRLVSDRLRRARRAGR